MSNSILVQMQRSASLSIGNFKDQANKIHKVQLLAKNGRTDIKLLVAVQFEAWIGPRYHAEHGNDPILDMLTLKNTQ